MTESPKSESRPTLAIHRVGETGLAIRSQNSNLQDNAITSTRSFMQFCFMKFSPLPSELQQLIWEDAMPNTNPCIEATYSEPTYFFLSLSSRSFIASHVCMAHLQQQYISIRPTLKELVALWKAKEHDVQGKRTYLRLDDMLYIPELCFLDVFAFIANTTGLATSLFLPPAPGESVRNKQQAHTNITLITSLKVLRP